jgi:hypothetical protein
LATTLQNILKGLRNANLLPKGQVNAGITEGLNPPYVSILDYAHELTYDTGGPTMKEAVFKLLVVAKDADAAETLAEAVDTALNTSTDLTATTMRLLQETYRSSQMDERLQQWGVEIGYKLTEDIQN